MGLPSFHPVGGVSAPGGSATWVEIPAPSAGTIGTVVAVQTSGALDGAALDLYCSAQPQAVSPPYDPDIYRLTAPDQLAIANGESLRLVNDLAICYRNLDGTSANPGRRLYAKLEPGGAGAKTFDLALTIEGVDL